MNCSIFRSLLDRQLHGRLVPTRAFFDNFSDLGEAAGTVAVDPCGISTLPFCCSYSQVYFNCHLLAVADEQGYVSVIDTTRRIPTSLRMDAHPSDKPKAQWLAHRNAIFDISWTKGDSRLLTAAGDQTVAVWETGHARQLGTFVGHTGSVVSISPHKAMEDVCASGSRDGSIRLWDTRVCAAGSYNGSAMFNSVLHIQDAHPHVLDGTKRRRKKHESKNAVTCVHFLQQDTVLLSAGASDGIVKFWDVRNPRRPTSTLVPASKAQYQELECILSQSSGVKKHGITSITTDKTGGRLLVSCVNGSHHLYSSMHPHKAPLATFEGHTRNSFYVKAAFSPDGTHFIAGSSDSNAYIWQVGKPSRAPYVLSGHEGEVTGVAWCPTDMCQVATCSDDYLLKVWHVNRNCVKKTEPPQPHPPTPALRQQPAAVPPTPRIPTPHAQGHMHSLEAETVPQAGPSRSPGVPLQEDNAVAPRQAAVPSPRPPAPPRVPFTPCDNTMGTNQQNKLARQRAQSTGGNKVQKSILSFFTPPMTNFNHNKRYLQTSIAAFLPVASSQAKRQKTDGKGVSSSAPPGQPTHDEENQCAVPR